MLKEGRVRKGGLNPDPKTSRPLPPEGQRSKNRLIKKFIYPYEYIKDLEKQLSELKNQPRLDEKEVEKIILKTSAIEEIELKNGAKIGYRVIGQAGFENMITELCKLQSKNQVVIAEGKNDGIYPVTMKDTSVFTIIIKNPVSRITKNPIEYEGKNVKIILLEVEDDK